MKAYWSIYCSPLQLVVINLSVNDLPIGVVQIVCKYDLFPTVKSHSVICWYGLAESKLSKWNY